MFIFEGNSCVACIELFTKFVQKKHDELVSIMLGVPLKLHQR
jgi:hypothetical protein